MTQREQQLKTNIKDFNKVIENASEKILDLELKKYRKYKNILLKIITFGFYDWNKQIENKIKDQALIIELFTEKISDSNLLLSDIKNRKRQFFLKVNINTQRTTSKPINITYNSKILHI